MQCKSPTPSASFILRKEGFVLNSVKPYNLTEETADFHITDLRQNDGGHYTCEYYSKWPHDTLSHPSDALFLLVTGEDGLPQRDGQRLREGLEKGRK